MRLRSTTILLVLSSLLLGVAVAGASTEGIGNPTLRVVNGGNDQTAVIYSDGITDGGLAGNGAISWDIFLTVPNTIALADFNVTAGQVWINQCPGAFNVVKTTQSSTIPGQNAFYIIGGCSATRTGPPVTGSNVPVATVVFTSQCSQTGSFNINLTTGGDPMGDLTDMYDTNNELYLFPETRLTDGGDLCGATAVTMSGLDATANNAAPLAAAWPLLAGAGVLAAGGAYALLRRKR